MSAFSAVGVSDISPRVVRAVVDPGFAAEFLAAVAGPVADAHRGGRLRGEFLARAGVPDVSALLAAVADRRRGVLWLRFPPGLGEDDLLRLLVAVGEALGPAVPDLGQDGRPWRKITATYAPGATRLGPNFHRNPCVAFPLHTDGAFHDPPPDWFALAKVADTSPGGGRSRLLHLDDWPDLAAFRDDPAAGVPLRWETLEPLTAEDRGRLEAAGYRTAVDAPVFRDTANGPCVRFFARERRSLLGPGFEADAAQTRYLYRLADALAAVAGVVTLPLAPGEAVFANNAFVLHGREPFPPGQAFERTVWRVRGAFAPPPGEGG